MFQKFTTESARDFVQRYQGTYGFFTKGDKRTLVMLSRVEAERGVTTFVDKDGMSYSLNANAADDVGFEFLPPKSEWHNTAIGPILVQRIAATQYRRGICDRNTALCNIAQQTLPVSFEYLLPIYESTTTPKEALKKGYVAISPQFALDINRQRVYLFNKLIGFVDDKLSITLDSNYTDLFTTELVDALRRVDIEGTVK